MEYYSTTSSASPPDRGYELTVAFGSDIVEQRAQAGPSIDTTLFWGAFAFGAGVFATVIGLANATLSIQAAAPIQPEHHRLIARGLMAAFGSTGYGLFVFMATGLVWLGLRRWRRKVVVGGE